MCGQAIGDQVGEGISNVLETKTCQLDTCIKVAE